MRYLTESGAAALATSSNMQALSYLYEVQTLIEETKDDEEPLAAEEETARLESLIGQVRVNFTDTAILRLTEVPFYSTPRSQVKPPQNL